MKLVDTNLMRRLFSAVARKSNTNLGELATDNKASLVSAINEVVENTGNTAELTTKNKSNLVTAINEINGKIKIYDAKITNFGEYTWTKDGGGSLWWTELFTIANATQVLSITCTYWHDLPSTPLMSVRGYTNNKIILAFSTDPTSATTGMIDLRVCYI